MKKKFSWGRVPIHVFFILYSLVCILPFILILSISFSNENDIINNGFSFIPQHFDTAAYKQIFGNPSSLIQGYLITIVYAVGGTLLKILIEAMMGYVLSRDVCAFKKPLNALLVITMFFSGGLIPSYIINTQWFHLGDSIWIYLLSGLMSAYNVFVFRTFFSTIPKSLIESAMLDGASEMNILRIIVIPLSKPVIATFSFMSLIAKCRA